MGDNHEQDFGEVTHRLRRVRERDAGMWGRRIATADVTPAMVSHNADPGVRCLCEECDGIRVQPKLPTALRNTRVVNRRRTLSGPAPLEERGPEPRKPVRANAPVQTPDLTPRQIELLMKWRR